MYESTPQHLIDEESHPGVLADMLNSSSSSSESSSSDGSDSDSSSSSHQTTKRIKRALRRKRRKSNASSKDTHSVTRTPSSLTKAPNSIAGDFATSESPMDLSPQAERNLEGVFSGDEADGENAVTSRDFEHEKHHYLKSLAEKAKKKK